MNYSKKILIIKDTFNSSCKIKGVVRTELYNENFLITISLIGGFFKGLKLFFKSKNEYVEFDIDGSNCNFSIDSLDCLEFYFVYKDNLVAVAYENIVDERNFLNCYEKKKFTPYKKANSESENFENSKVEYNDEEVATENYYKLNYEEKYLFDQNATFENSCEKEENKSCKQFEIKKDAPNFSNAKSENYYQGVKEKLDELFETYPKELNLMQAIYGGKFISIPYDNDKKYIVGTIAENETVKYICYGVAGKRGNLPDELGYYCRFIPIKNQTENGYYLLFQYANTGKTVTF